MKYIIDYQINNKLKANYLFVFIIVSLMIYLFTISYNYKYKNYEITTGVVFLEEEEYYLNVYIKKDLLSMFLKQNTIEINNELEFFDVVSINPELKISSNLNYYEITITSKINEIDIIQNNILDIKFYYGEEKIINKIKKIIGG